MDDYECVEVMSGMIAPLSAKYAEVVETAAWVEQLHDGMPHYESRSQKCVQAYQDLQSRLPMRGNPKQIAGMYHQLEQLVKGARRDRRCFTARSGSPGTAFRRSCMFTRTEPGLKGSRTVMGSKRSRYL